MQIATNVATTSTRAEEEDHDDQGILSLLDHTTYARLTVVEVEVIGHQCCSTLIMAKQEILWEEHI